MMVGVATLEFVQSEFGSYGAGAGGCESGGDMEVVAIIVVLFFFFNKLHFGSVDDN